MIFTQLSFFFFFALVWLVAWALRENRARKLWLLAASCFFYGLTGLGFLALMLATALADYFFGRMLAVVEDARRRRWILVASLVTNLGVLAFFKGAGFFVENVQAALRLLGLDVSMPVLDIVMPIGISFYTFQSLSYTIDVYRRLLAPTRSAVDFLFFVTFFPQLVAGPIVRASEFLDQVTSARRLQDVRVRRCCLLFLAGFVKKVCIADHVASFIDPVFATPTVYDGATLWLASLFYVVQVYCDFSGYSDMAIALGGLLGYRLPRNFFFPYLSFSVTDFWRRWHISLSSWFRDYLYIPLGGNRSGPLRTARNLLVVFLLCGLWHGADWTFLTFGLMHGTALVLERFGLERVLGRVPRVLAWAYTIFVVCLGFILFRSSDMQVARAFYVGMAGLGQGTQALTSVGWGFLALLLFVHVLSYRELLVPHRVWNAPRWAFALGFGAVVALLVPWIAVGYSPFIYFRF